MLCEEVDFILSIMEGQRRFKKINHDHYSGFSKADGHKEKAL